VDAVSKDQAISILKKAIERMKAGEVPIVDRTYRFVFSGHYAGDKYEDSLRYELNLRGDKPVFSTYSYHFKLSTAIQMDDYCEILFVEIVRLMVESNNFGVDVANSVVYQKYFTKVT